MMTQHVEEDAWFVLRDVHFERHRQDEKWGEQNHTDSLWSHILGEEYGEACRAVNEVVWGGLSTAHLREELIQVAAVAVAWIECIDRRANGSQEEVTR
jgi:hypothetical protein